MDRGNAEIAPVLQLHGSGTTNPSKLLWKVMDDLTVRVRFGAALTAGRCEGLLAGWREAAARALSGYPSHFVRQFKLVLNGNLTPGYRVGCQSRFLCPPTAPRFFCCLCIFFSGICDKLTRITESDQA